MPVNEGPVLVRHREIPWSAQPGVHTHNATRRLQNVSRKLRRLRWLGNARTFFLLAGLCGVGYYGYALSNEYIYQKYENWAFDQQIAGRSRASFADFIREQTPLRILLPREAPTLASSANPPVPSQVMRPVSGSVLGRVEIDRLHLSAMVREGVDLQTLSVAVGHIPSTALPGQPGNFAIAAHRDTLFRALKDIEPKDRVTFRSPTAIYTYEVDATKIVKPSDVSVLRDDGGGLVSPGANGLAKQGGAQLLTMITCYPFRYIGAAPKRFIVQAKLVSAEPASSIAEPEPHALSAPGSQRVQAKISSTASHALSGRIAKKPNSVLRGRSHLKRRGLRHVPRERRS